jgi:two-component system OmpR family sensor kinase
MSLRTRLLLVLVATVLLSLAIVSGFTYAFVTKAQLDQIDQELERAHPPVERAAGETGDLDRAMRDAAPGYYIELRTPAGDPLLTIPLRDRDGSVLTLGGVELPEPTANLSDDQAVFDSVMLDGDAHMRLRISRQSDDNVLVIGRSMESIEHTRQRLLWALVATTAGALLTAVALGTWLVRVGLRPLVAVEEAAAGIDDDDLTQRVPGDSPSTEVGQLAHTINTMLARLEDAFAQRARDLAAVQESEARMRQFVGDASHELRTPLAATAAYAELFERGARDRPDDLERAMRGIRGETARMAELVDDLLLLAQLDEGRPLTMSSVDLSELAVDAVDAARTVDSSHPISVRLDDVVAVTADAGRLRQVVDNLLANVRTHTPPGTACRVVVSEHGGRAVLTVSDDGPGMSPADRERAFDRFHRADSSRARASGGAGLGLSIVAAIVERHGGHVTLDSHAGRGTTVTIELPLAEGHREHPGEERS